MTFDPILAVNSFIAYPIKIGNISIKSLNIKILLLIQQEFNELDEIFKLKKVADKLKLAYIFSQEMPAGLKYLAWADQYEEMNIQLVYLACIKQLSDCFQLIFPNDDSADKKVKQTDNTGQGFTASMMYFGMNVLHLGWNDCQEVPLAGLYIMLLEHISHNVPKKEQKFVDLKTREMIDKIKLSRPSSQPAPYILTDRMPILKQK